MFWMSAVFVPLGLFVPGALFARRFCPSLWWAAGCLFSLVLLFHSVFWLGVLHVPIALRTVLPILLTVTAAAAWWARRSLAPSRASPTEKWDFQDRVLLFFCVLSGAALLYRAATTPLLGFDSPFRWEFLARRILELGNFNYYPPVTPADFKSYFYVDGIPPLVSFGNWWIYASAGGRSPALLSVFAAAQFAVTLAFVYGAASELYSRRAGLLAAGMLAACPLFFDGVVIGQETGLTAAAFSATLYFLVRARQTDDLGALVSAGLVAGLCALTREYGWMALIAGLVVLRWRRFSTRQAVIFASIAVAVAIPWYARNWARTGNPFFSLAVGPFPVNAIHDGIMQYYRTVLHADTAAVPLLLLFAPLQFPAGVPSALSRFREHGYLAIVAGIAILAWLQALTYTSGGLELSIRVLTPAVAVLSVAAAGALVRWRTLAVAATGVALCWTLAVGSVFPDPVDTFPEHAFQSPAPHSEYEFAGPLAENTTQGYRVLSDSAYLYAAMADKGVEVVPVWSPEVRFLFDCPAEVADRRLRELRIETIVYYPTSLNARYLVAKSPFFAELPRRWREIYNAQGQILFYRP